MGSIKQMRAESPAMTFRLAPNAVLDPPEITLTIGPVTSFGLAMSYAGEGRFELGPATCRALLEAIRSWDLTTDGGGPVPCTPEVKEKLAASFAILFSTPLEGEERTLFGSALFRYATNPGNYLGN